MGDLAHDRTYRFYHFAKLHCGICAIEMRWVQRADADDKWVLFHPVTKDCALSDRAFYTPLSHDLFEIEGRVRNVGGRGNLFTAKPSSRPRR
jgi:hypothetical protein